MDCEYVDILKALKSPLTSNVWQRVMKLELCYLVVKDLLDPNGDDEDFLSRTALSETCVVDKGHDEMLDDACASFHEHGESILPWKR